VKKEHWRRIAFGAGSGALLGMVGGVILPCATSDSNLCGILGMITFSLGALVGAIVAFLLSRRDAGPAVFIGAAIGALVGTVAIVIPTLSHATTEIAPVLILAFPVTTVPLGAVIGSLVAARLTRSSRSA
jgi:hypothetical protein